jgi:hypothetical protein
VIVTRAPARLVAPLAIALTSCAGSSSNQSGTATQNEVIGVTPAQQMPLALALDGLDGRPVDIATFRGRAVLLIAFFMDDLPSQGILRHAERLARELGDDVAVVAVSGDRQPYRTHRDMAQIFARVNELQRTQILLADDAVRDGTSPLGEIEAVPTTFLVNRAGIVARRVQGYQDYSALRALVAPALPPH